MVPVELWECRDPMEDTHVIWIFPSGVKWEEVSVMDREEREVWSPVEEVVMG